MPRLPDRHRSDRRRVVDRRRIVGQVALVLIVASVVFFVVNRGDSTTDSASQRNGATTTVADGGPADATDRTQSTEVTGATDPNAPQTHGDDPKLDALWDACEAGNYRSCDDLFDRSGFGTGYEHFGATCGDRNDPDQGYCTVLYAASTGTGPGASSDPAPEPVDPVQSAAEDHGDDPELDALWDRCAAGDYGGCDDLYRASGFGTAYEEFATTCGHRNEPRGLCTELYQ